jgi:hypothetical protein
MEFNSALDCPSLTSNCGRPFVVAAFNEQLNQANSALACCRRSSRSSGHKFAGANRRLSCPTVCRPDERLTKAPIGAKAARATNNSKLRAERSLRRWPRY